MEQSTTPTEQNLYGPCGPCKTAPQVLPSEAVLKAIENSTLAPEPQKPPSLVTTAKETELCLTVAFGVILTKLGYDLKLPSLRETPTRAAKALMEMTTPTEFEFKVFDEEAATGMVILNGIWVSSLCEHHVLPFFGTATVAMIPGPSQRVLGLSKYARLVRYHASGLKTQERITAAIGQQLLKSHVKPAGVGVSLRCYHTCMSLRGVKDTSAVTTTQYLGGICKDDPMARSEFLNAVAHPQFMA